MLFSTVNDLLISGFKIICDFLFTHITICRNHGAAHEKGREITIGDKKLYKLNVKVSPNCK